MPDATLHRICREARLDFEGSISRITLVERERLVLKDACGIEVTEMSRDGAFCAYTILSDEVFVFSRRVTWTSPSCHDRTDQAISRTFTTLPAAQGSGPTES
ncbi:hypothetical protein [Microvirga yunnanensis]|uniref:hypothetical protein n=1 Tax=Microvirga yunnanensis TaxID=2953740 RepID=UPI0021C89662|nr:hypothetical protein [Microvirga sp. HBU65207]